MKGCAVLDSNTGRCYFRENIQTRAFHARALPLSGTPMGQQGDPAHLPRVNEEDKLPKLPALPGSTAGSPHQEAVSNPHTTLVCRQCGTFQMQVSCGKSPKNSSTLPQLLIDKQPANGTRPS